MLKCRWLFTMVLIFGFLAQGALATETASSSAAQRSGEAISPLLIISLDGFRWDYCNLHPEQTPHLRRLKAEGASATALISVFPSNTFPNHYSIVTGLRPAHHGVINNTMFDPASGRFFRNSLPAAVRDSSWWGGEPIWVTAVKQGLHSACAFWPGSEAEIGGIRPDFWKPFDYSVPFESRLDELTGWLQLPANQRPSVITFYLEETNSVGHTFGPDAPETIAAIHLLDTRVGAILARLSAVNIYPNLVIVSDHGMTKIIPQRCIAIEDFIDPAVAQIDFNGTVAGLRPLHGTVDELMEKLSTLPESAKAYRLEELPERYHLRDNPRLPPVWILPVEGGFVGTREGLATWLAKTRGEHGYDPELPNMKATLIVHGPAFKTGGVVVEEVENIHLYNMFCAILHLKPAANDGDERLARSLLKSIPGSPAY